MRYKHITNYPVSLPTLKTNTYRRPPGKDDDNPTGRRRVLPQHYTAKHFEFSPLTYSLSVIHCMAALKLSRGCFFNISQSLEQCNLGSTLIRRRNAILYSHFTLYSLCTLTSLTGVKHFNINKIESLWIEDLYRYTLMFS